MNPAYPLLCLADGLSPARPSIAIYFRPEDLGYCSRLEVLRGALSAAHRFYDRKGKAWQITHVDPVPVVSKLQKYLCYTCYNPVEKHTVTLSPCGEADLSHIVQRICHLSDDDLRGILGEGVEEQEWKDQIASVSTIAELFDLLTESLPPEKSGDTMDQEVFAESDCVRIEDPDAACEETEESPSKCAKANRIIKARNIVFFAGVIFAFLFGSPIIGLFSAHAFAFLLGCTITSAGPSECIFFGLDMGNRLYAYAIPWIGAPLTPIAFAYAFGDIMLYWAGLALFLNLLCPARTKKIRPKASEIICPTCGNNCKTQQTPCTHCGTIPARKNRTTYILLALFFGFFGIHNFYAGYKGRGMTYLLITLLTGWMIVPLVCLGTWILFEMYAVTIDAQGRPFSSKGRKRH